jgi:two-component system cell cycle sensor histidine kinase/response regulator CckA
VTDEEKLPKPLSPDRPEVVTVIRRAVEGVQASERRFYGTFFEEAPIGVALVLPDGRWLKVNRALCDLVGYSEAELLALTFKDITFADDLDVDRENMRRLLAGEIRSYKVEKRYIHALGHLVTVLVNVSLVRDDDDKPRYFISQIQDISERKRTENALRESNEKFLELANNITDAFWIRSPDMREVHYISPAFDRIWGRSLNILYAYPQRWSDYTLPEDRERVIGAFGQLMGDTPSLDVEYRIVRPGGEIRWVRTRGFQVRDAANTLTRLIGIVTDITDWRRATEELRESERRFSAMLRELDMVALMLDRDSRVTYCNDYLLRLTNRTREEVVGGDWFELFLPPELFAELKGVRSALLTDQPAAWHHENEILTRSGERRLIRWNNSVLRSAGGDIIGTASIGEDITERKQLEAQLLESQKMETVGKLAGGIAHEFNGILTAIIGQSELLLGGLPQGNPLVHNATEISKAAIRASRLTRQLLEYSGRTLLWPESLDLNQIISRVAAMFHHLIGQDVDVRIVPAPDLYAITADAGQIEQVVMNLAINACDAMQGSGKLTLTTTNVSFHEGSSGLYPELGPRNYAKVMIADTGPGMSADVQARVFEPFFSSKGVGHGTGLGLSTCYGIIKQNGGHIFVFSELNRGTTFEIYLPQAALQMKIAPQGLDLPDLPHGTETILLVEKDPALREMAETLLGRLGYMVWAAAGAIEAANLGGQRHTGHVDLLVTDVAASEGIPSLDPRTRVLFTSAYTSNATGALFLQRPFTPSALAQKVREVLDQ